LFLCWKKTVLDHFVDIFFRSHLLPLHTIV
jgi:hypothetical protein